jgi:hypothetical protein
MRTRRVFPDGMPIYNKKGKKMKNFFQIEGTNVIVPLNQSTADIKLSIRAAMAGQPKEKVSAAIKKALRTPKNPRVMSELSVDREG